MRKVMIACCIVLGSLGAMAYEEAAAVYIVAPMRPPADKEEVVARAPGPHFVWIKGHWMWHNKAWVWESGHYATLPHQSAKWRAGHWEERAHGWLWIPGHWI